jgi:hypothetical protein
MNAATNISIKGADSETSYRRGQWYANGERGGMVNVQVHRTGRGLCFVTWNGHTGRGWMKGWRKSGLTEQQALDFAAAKWPVMIEWLNKLEPVTPVSASELFSAQINTMM